MTADNGCSRKYGYCDQCSVIYPACYKLQESLGVLLS